MDGVRAALDGGVLTPGDPGYDHARRAWNAGVDHHPAVIAQCRSTADVVAAVGFARERGLDVSVRGGAHNSVGLAVADGGVMIDLRAMSAVAVDAPARRARVGGGALLRDLDAATLPHGLATPLGMIGHTGVGGLTLGGGMGWLSRKFGLSIDNLVSAEVVLADGRVVRASADSEPDLFWALRGGGGNFGVVTEFEFRLHPVEPMVEFGFFFWSAEQGQVALKVIRDLVADLAPELNVVVAALTAPPAPFVPVEHHFTPGYALLLVGFDGTPAHAATAARVREALPPTFDAVVPMPYVALQQLTDADFAWGSHAHVQATFVDDLTDDVVGVLTQRLTQRSSPASTVLMYLLDGAYSQVPEHDTAFGGGRSRRYCVFLIGFAPDAELAAADREWVRELHDALRPVAIGDGDGYVNDLVDFSDERVRATYGDKYDRLAAIKAVYDPGNLFRLNANIKPG